MRKITFIILIVFISKLVSSQVTFKVADVKLAKKPLYETTYKNAIEHRVSCKIESYNTTKGKQTLIKTHNNAFVVAVHYAYATHRPLVISPDMIWLLIEQGFALHVNYYADSLQSSNVDFKGKKIIVVKNKNFIKGDVNNNWAGEISQFSDSIKEYIGEELHSVLVPKFSTTKLNEKVAFEITLMDAVEEYFDYTVMTLEFQKLLLMGQQKTGKRYIQTPKN